MFSAAHKKRLATAMAGAALASALIVSGASADPHAIDAHARAAVEQGYQDLRSPDTVDAARAAGDPPEVAPPQSSIAASAGGEYQDLRSPDTRDHAEDYQPMTESEPVVDESPAPGGFDWVSAAIGAAVAGGLSLVLLAALGMRRPANRRAASA